MIELTCALATWRITHMLLKENGPWRAFRRLRSSFGVVYDDADDGDTVVSYKYEITVCSWCLSMWVGGFVTLLYFSQLWWLLVPYALSAFTVSWNYLIDGSGG